MLTQRRKKTKETDNILIYLHLDYSPCAYVRTPLLRMSEMMMSNVNWMEIGITQFVVLIVIIVIAANVTDWRLEISFWSLIALLQQRRLQTRPEYLMDFWK